MKTKSVIALTILIFTLAGLLSLRYFPKKNYSVKNKQINLLISKSQLAKTEYLKSTKLRNQFIEARLAQFDSFKNIQDIIKNINSNNLQNQNDFDLWDINQTRLNNFIAELIIFSDKAKGNSQKNFNLTSDVITQIQKLDKVCDDQRKHYHILVSQIENSNLPSNKKLPIFKAEALWLQKKK